MALLDGLPVAVLERQGKVLRIFQESVIQEAIVMLALSYKQKRIFPLLNRIAIKEYPPPAEEALQAAGFSRQMLDYVMWQS